MSKLGLELELELEQRPFDKRQNTTLSHTQKKHLYSYKQLLHRL